MLCVAEVGGVDNQLHQEDRDHGVSIAHQGFSVGGGSLVGDVQPPYA